VLFTEELSEFDGTSLTDEFSIKLNGKEIGTLSNGAALSIKNLVYSGSNDLILNPVGSGALADTIKADAYTRILRLTGAVDRGTVNTLTIEVKDGRDAFLDSGLLIKDGSFKTFQQPGVSASVTGVGGGGDPHGGDNGGVPSNDDPIVRITPTGNTPDPNDPTGQGGTTVTVAVTGHTEHVDPVTGAATVTDDPPVELVFRPGEGPKDFPTGGGGAGHTHEPGDTYWVTYEVTTNDPTKPALPIPPTTWVWTEPTNNAPVITAAAGEIRVAENSTAVTRVAAVDPDAGQLLTYSINGGADRNLFTIDPTTGALKFKAAPDFEHPGDAGGDNVYDVIVGVSDNGNPSMSATQAYSVRVTDTAETSTLVVKFVSETAGYRNTVGWYNTATLAGGLLFGSVEADGSHPTVIPGVTTASFVVGSADVGRIGFFLIPDGGDICSNPDALKGPVKVIKLADGNWAVALTDANGNVQTDHYGKPIVLDGVESHAFFTETGKNAGGVDYASSKVGSSQTATTLAGDTADGPTGLLAWEDQAAHIVRSGGSGVPPVYGSPGDADYNDAVFQVSEFKGQTLTGDGTPNVLTGGIANDVLDGLGDNDTLDGAAGSDRVWGGDGNDIFIHRIAENVGSSDSYDGGTGQDTLRLVLTSSEWARPDVQSDIARYLAYINAPAGVGTPFTFNSTQLGVVNIEKLEVMVEGVSLDPRDEAVTANPDSLSATEDVGASVNLLGNDAVPDRAASVTLVTNGSRGTATLTPSLSGATQTAVLSYAPSAALQSLRAGETVTDTLTYKVVDVDGDSSTASVAITIVGVNDAARISGTSSGSVTEDSLTKATGKLTVTDVDTGENHAVPQTGVAGTYGSFSVDATGAWAFTLNNAASNVQALTQGQSVKDSFTLESLDGTASQAVTITINGCNDAAVIGAPTVPGVTEDVSVASGKLKATGAISVADPDHDQSSFQTSVVKAGGDLGSLSLAANGSYTYSVDNSAVQYLAAGEAKVDTFTVKSLDGTSKAVAFTIHGASDAAAIGAPSVADVTEDVSVASGKLKATGTISVADADHDQSSFQTSVVKAGGDLGSLSLAANGSYTYSVDNSAVQYLGDGGTKVDSFTIQSVDGTSKTVAFTIHGANELINVGSHSSVSGTAGPDTFNFSSAASAGATISGFAHGSDVLQMSASGFGHGLVANSTPALVVAADHASATHAGSGGYFIFDNQGSDAGTVYWDANGNGGSDAIALAKLTGVTSLVPSDFHVV
jgi:VCBS repeat-containing protein